MTNLRSARSASLLRWAALALGLAAVTTAHAAGPTPLGPAFQVNTFTPGYQWYPDVATTPAGEFLVVWIDEGLPAGQTSGWAISAQRFAAGGAAVGE